MKGKLKPRAADQETEWCKIDVTELSKKLTRTRSGGGGER